MSHPTITTNDIIEVLRRDLLAGNKKPPMLLAYYGIGKSMQTAKFASEYHMHYIDYRAAYKTFNDVRGYGIPDRESNTMRFLMDEDWDFATDKPNCLHLEELLNASTAVQKVLMQATLDRRIGKFHFPEDTFICASSNKLAHKTGVERMLAALADRFSIFHVDPDLDGYMNYLADNGRSPEVFAFLSSNPSAPYDFDIKKWDNESNLPTFRSFDRLDELVATYSSGAEAARDRLFKAQACSKVGPKWGEQFAQFIKLTSTIGDVDKMLSEADTCKIPNEPDIKWLIACRSITLATPENLEQVLLLAHRLTDSKLDTPDTLQPMESFVGSSLRRRKKDLLRSKAMISWQLKHADELSTI